MPESRSLWFLKRNSPEILQEVATSCRVISSPAEDKEISLRIDPNSGAVACSRKSNRTCLLSWSLDFTPLFAEIIPDQPGPLPVNGVKAPEILQGIRFAFKMIDGITPATDEAELSIMKPGQHG